MSRIPEPYSLIESKAKEILIKENILLPAGQSVNLELELDISSYRFIAGGLKLNATPAANVTFSFIPRDSAATEYGGAPTSITQIAANSGSMSYGDRVNTRSLKARVYVQNSDTVDRTLVKAVLVGFPN